MQGLPYVKISCLSTSIENYWLCCETKVTTKKRCARLCHDHSTAEVQILQTTWKNPARLLFYYAPDSTTVRIFFPFRNRSCVLWPNSGPYSLLTDCPAFRFWHSDTQENISAKKLTNIDIDRLPVTNARNAEILGRWYLISRVVLKTAAELELAYRDVQIASPHGSWEKKIDSTTISNSFEKNEKHLLYCTKDSSLRNYCSCCRRCYRIIHTCQNTYRIHRFQTAPLCFIPLNIQFNILKRELSVVTFGNETRRISSS